MQVLLLIGPSFKMALIFVFSTKIDVSYSKAVICKLFFACFNLSSVLAVVTGLSADHLKFFFNIRFFIVLFCPELYLINKTECMSVRLSVCVYLYVCISRKNNIYCWLVRHCYVFLLLQQQLKQRRFYGR
jgi:hypothetical protein